MKVTAYQSSNGSLHATIEEYAVDEILNVIGRNNSVAAKQIVANHSKVRDILFEIDADVVEGEVRGPFPMAKIQREQDR